ncbi:tetratricopeptide repeat protein [Synechococcus sp. CBW1006]|uniref:tetratricopeptide repeat protein n=1 Tax=Synechococcus sp. CBW1006 TaxID=1353138 RepID=UPI0018CD276E|nr:tetratricopeptide repeat protein [Synechococcus sp. CBW1006]QPN65700.1 tetratricopeptide repeat protein [Synechococcus sp. CBW1006]
MGSQSHQLSEQDARQVLRLGQRRVALAIYQNLLSSGIGDPAGIHLQISKIQGLLGNAEAQNHHVLLAAEFAPSDPRVVLAYGSYLFRINQLADARQTFEQVSGESGLESLAIGNLAAVEISEGNPIKAKQYLIKALQLNPNNSHALDLSLKLLGKEIIDSAVLSHFLNENQATNSSLLFMLIGQQLEGQEHSTTALQWLEKAIDVDPANVSAQLQRAKILSKVGRSDEAIEQLLVSLAIEPGHIELMLTMGYCLQQVNELNSAIYFFQRILEIEEIHTEASNLLGCCYRFAGQEEESIPIFSEALEHAPCDGGLLCNLASALRNVSRIEESLVLSKQIRSLYPLSREGFYSYMFTHSTLPRSAAAEMLSVAKEYWQAYRESLLKQNPAWRKLADRHPLPSTGQLWQSLGANTEKIKVGILSAEIGAHVVGMFLRSFLQHYDRSTFHVTLITANRRYEVQENELVDMADAVVVLHGLSVLAAAQAINDQKFDVILETSGYTNNTQIHLLTFRLAPVQCHYIGYHATTGLNTIDYLIGDSIVTPTDFDDLFIEKIWRLPDIWLAITYHDQLPAASSLAQTDSFTFGSFNNGAKFNQKTFAYWASALKAVSESVLVIKDQSLTSTKRKEWISESLEALGVSRSRLHFLPASESWQDHMSIYNIVDACLDCTSWCGSTTVFDSLSMGTPYLAIKGDTMASRMSSSILSGYGCAEWIANSTTEFAEIARRMADHRQGLRGGKQAMQRRVLEQSLTKAKRTTQHLEQAIKLMLTSAHSKRSAA